MAEQDEYFTKFEEAGEPVVRKNVKVGVYQGKKAKYAQTWLDEQESTKRESVEQEEIEIAREANRLARHSRTAAVVAAIAAMIAAVAAVISIAMSIE